ncbi:hypothetical protein K4H00_25795, partial [Mycobacterium tuberculosis]|nr:hypothetical protein [Mycobacterium tuberculosis]
MGRDHHIDEEGTRNRVMEALNQCLCLQMDATPAAPGWLIALATFIARDLISIVPLLPVVLWLWRPTERRLVVK